MRVLLVKTSSMGDVVHTFPAVTEALAALNGLASAGLAVRGGDGLWRLGKITDRPLLPLETEARGRQGTTASQRGAGQCSNSAASSVV